jgi:tRNA-uridine 2-sulfurtransferase
MTEKIKAVALMSGGLDSVLAAAIIKNQGVQVTGISCKHPFHAGSEQQEQSQVELGAKQIGIELVMPDVTQTMLEMVQNPPHGYGKHLNPCIDCRIMYLGEGEKLMKELDAHFLITGEVLGQRPMSQRRDTINIIDRDSSLRGLIIRPLSAKLLNPTIPEEKGWVDREKLYEVSGRGRKPQYKLAEELGITEFSAPAGGCLLTMEDFARKMLDLIERSDSITAKDIELLKHGRQFRLSDKAKIIVGKDDSDNKKLFTLAEDTDVLIKMADRPGPVGVLTGIFSEAEIETSCKLVGRYVKGNDPVLKFLVTKKGEENILETEPFGRFEAKSYLI